MELHKTVGNRYSNICSPLDIIGQADLNQTLCMCFFFFFFTNSFGLFSNKCWAFINKTIGECIRATIDVNRLKSTKDKHAQRVNLLCFFADYKRSSASWWRLRALNVLNPPTILQLCITVKTLKFPM